MVMVRSALSNRNAAAGTRYPTKVVEVTAETADQVDGVIRIFGENQAISVAGRHREDYGSGGVAEFQGIEKILGGVATQSMIDCIMHLSLDRAVGVAFSGGGFPVALTGFWRLKRSERYHSGAKP